MIVTEPGFKKANDGFFEYLMQIEYPDYDNQGIINNAHIATFLETICEEYITYYGHHSMDFSACITNYSVVFESGIPFQLKASSNFFEPMIPMARLKWEDPETTNTLTIFLVDSENPEFIFARTTFTFDWKKRFIKKPDLLDLPKESRKHYYLVPIKANNINRFGMYHLSRIATFLESTHLWFFGKGYLKTNWIRCPLPIIVKSINMDYYQPLTDKLMLRCILRVANPEGNSSVKFWIDIVDAVDNNNILARALLIAVYVEPDPRDWSSAHIETVPEQIRNQIRNFYYGN